MESQKEKQKENITLNFLIEACFKITLMLLQVIFKLFQFAYHHHILEIGKFYNAKKQKHKRQILTNFFCCSSVNGIP